MIIPDVNLLIYAVNVDAPLHLKAKSWLVRTLSESETVGLSWHVLLAFVRLTTRRGVFRNPLLVESAFDLLDEWVDQPFVTLIHPGPRHFYLVRDLLEPLGTAGDLVSDAHLPALAIENQAELCSSSPPSPDFRESDGAILSSKDHFAMR